MANEIELKLSLSPAAQRRFLALPVLADARSRRESRLVNIYYDTPDLDLHRQAIALRLRKDGHTWLQTVKCGGVSAAGLSSRPEWETPWRGEFDFSPVDAEPVREWLEQPRIRPYLTPAFETNFRRITWVFGADERRQLLLTLDRGWIEAKGRREAICELEIELAGASLEPLFELARSIAAALPVLPATASKAERGYRLFAGTDAAPLKPVRASLPRLDAKLTPRAAFHRVALSCLDHLQANVAGALHQDDPEFVHQARVALRRLRAALGLFRPALPKGMHAIWQTALRQLGQQFGAARNQDVIAESIITPALAALPQDDGLAALARHANGTRNQAHAALNNDACTLRLGQFLVQALADLHNPAFAASDANHKSLRRFSRERMQRLEARVTKLARQAECHPRDPDRLHALRIALKRLRYAGEFLHDVYPTPQRRVAALQERLGQLNDLALAGPVLLAYAGTDAERLAAVTRLGEWHGPRYAGLLKGLKKDVRRLRQQLNH